MDTISVKGETYVKGSKIAKELGYTADYVGQLCRSGQVEGTLVGRSWYVLEKSIRAHKKNRYRSTLVKSAKAVTQMVDERVNEVEPSYLKQPVTTSYEEDEAPLFPSINKSETKSEVSFEEKVADVASTVEGDNVIEVTVAPVEKALEEETRPAIKLVESRKPRTLPAAEIQVRPAIRMISAAANRPVEEPETSYYESKDSRLSAPILSFISVVSGVLLVVALLGLERRSFVSPITPPDNYYHFNPAAGLEAAATLWLDNF